ncbi:hypothetical protein QEH59_18565 [Coraliomargarita sp. SDUM461004]|uniref:Uncharacterized protein n=1 Tax=Thalassobacterium sedimentorum TaxID=3041258 RepID=A0ABU1ANW5_9BACT|nr:hypothetical protein [Coraliomargarita sp. SDUM461004]MDQ8196439.1 hypothetical protein [Coraliomargarita sp. SDUM461004]
MAVIIKTQNPSELLKKIKKAIDENTVRSWSYDKDGDFTHDAEQWKDEAWLRPKTYTGELRLGIVAPKDTKLSSQIYGLYHGRFIDMVLTHFDSEFTMASATAGKTDPDTF